MAETRRGNERWGVRVAALLVEGRRDPGFRAHLHRLLLWLVSPDAPDAEPLRRELRSRGVAPSAARALALRRLDELLFSGPDTEPARVLGIDPAADAAAIRTRYRLLMRVYHPDLNAENPVWLTGRVERISRAYSRMRRRGAAHAPPRLPPVIERARSRPPSLRRRLRRVLGRPRAARRRVVACVVLVGASAVVHTCVVQRAWYCLLPAGAAPAHAAPAPNRAGGR